MNKKCGCCLGPSRGNNCPDLTGDEWMELVTVPKAPTNQPGPGSPQLPEAAQMGVSSGGVQATKLEPFHHHPLEALLGLLLTFRAISQSHVVLFWGEMCGK